MKKEEYLKVLTERMAKSRIRNKFQLIGLEIATILGDEKHKTLYIKLAKERGSEKLLEIAKTVAERSNVKNKGAYFMKIVQEDKQ